LLKPVYGEVLTSKHKCWFEWDWSGPALGENLAFDLRIWSQQEEQNGEPKRGVDTPTQHKKLKVDLRYVPAILDYDPGDYYWTVVVVEVDTNGPPKVVGEWGEKRKFTYMLETHPGSTPVPPPTRTQP
jgi:hypothetical protein